LVIVKLLGGLGNQMFQYATGRAVAIRLGTALLLDTSAFEQYDLRRYELGAFAIEARVATSNDLARAGGNPALPSWLRRLGRVAGLTRPAALYKEAAFTYEENILHVCAPVHLDGYWQSERYFLDVAGKLRKEFTLTQPLDEANLRILDKIRDPVSQAVSLHIRRGDYVSNAHTAQFHGVCTLDYYRSAVDLISARVSNPHFFVFSDDPDWVRDNLSLDHLMTVVAVNSADRGVLDMTLMMSCRHHVIANSSFSWWGAWLNPHEDKIVVAPKRWFSGASLDTRDLIPSSWVRL
jgi:hypothetical protein